MFIEARRDSAFGADVRQVPRRPAVAASSTRQQGTSMTQTQAEDIADRFAESLNGAQQWLSITPIVENDGQVEIVIDIHGHFAASAQEATPLALCAALAAFFDSMATQAKHAAESILSDLQSATHSS